MPFAQIASVAPGLRMYHIVVRDPKGHSLPLQVTNYQHDHRGASYDDLVFAYDFAAGEKRAAFTVEAVATATPRMRRAFTLGSFRSATTTWPGKTTASRIACTASR